VNRELTHNLANGARYDPQPDQRHKPKVNDGSQNYRAGYDQDLRPEQGRAFALSVPKYVITLYTKYAVATAAEKAHTARWLSRPWCFLQTHQVAYPRRAS
jgi:hypothetical protein